MKAIVLEEYKLTRIALVKTLENRLGLMDVYSNDKVNLDEIKLKNPDIILFDFDIFNKDESSPKQIKSFLPDVKIVVLAQKEDLEREILKNPFVDFYCAKDVEEEKLQKIINGILQDNFETEAEREEILNINSNASDVFDVA